MFLYKIAASLAICALASTVNAAPNSAASDSSNQCDASAIELVAPQVTILKITAERVDDYPVPQDPVYNVFVPLSSAPSTVSFCNVTVTYTHPGWDDRIQVFAGLPLQGWNRKFLALGGAGFSTNAPLDVLATMAAFGYASVATDGGQVWQDISWALKANSTLVNYPLLTDMASESLKDMTVLGRQLAERHYGETAERAYWVGCSQGGRQGMMMAQRYAELFDGILANAPALRWNDLLVGMQWQSVTMYETGTAPSPCVLDAFTQAAIDQCDGDDGLEDGVINDPGSCGFDPYSLVGRSVSCGADDEINVTDKDAFVVRQILTGPPTTPGGNGNGNGNGSLFVGYDVGTNLSSAVSTSCADGHHNCSANGVIFANEWIPKFLAKDYAFDPLTITYDQFYRFFAQAKSEYDWVIGTGDADLRHLRLSGTKLLSFHGFADELIPPANTVRYYREARAVDAGVADYYRLFMAPGVMHCGGGLGPNPTAMLRVLEGWVEDGTAPTRLDAVATAANGTRGERQVCMYPESSRYTGGDVSLASSFTCS